MPQVNLIITRLAQSDLARVYDFLHDLGATKQADAVMRLLGKSFLATRNNPKNGRIYELSVNGEILENVREVLVFYGKGGYSYLFCHDMAALRY